MWIFYIVCLLFASSTFAATTSSRTSVRPTSTPSVKVAPPRVLEPATPPTKVDVNPWYRVGWWAYAVWTKSVNTVNQYLDEPPKMTKLANAIVYAKDEPVQLATLIKTTQLSTSGVNAGKILMSNFPSIVSNLNSIQQGVMTTNDATAAVNFNSCCTVLAAFGMLWASASAAMKVANTKMPNLEASVVRCLALRGLVVGHLRMGRQCRRWLCKYIAQVEEAERLGHTGTKILVASSLTFGALVERVP